MTPSVETLVSQQILEITTQSSAFYITSKFGRRLRRVIEQVNEQRAYFFKTLCEQIHIDFQLMKEEHDKVWRSAPKGLDGISIYLDHNGDTKDIARKLVEGTKYLP